MTTRFNFEILKNLPSSSSTGRFYVFSKRTGKIYFVEPIGDPHVQWGDVNPATREVEGSYGDKFRGSIDAKDSIITPGNGFRNIVTLEAGHSPLSYIDQLDAQYPDKN